MHVQYTHPADTEKDNEENSQNHMAGSDTDRLDPFLTDGGPEKNRSNPLDAVKYSGTDQSQNRPVYKIKG